MKVRSRNDLNVIGGRPRQGPRPEQILLDVNLPRKDGREVPEEIKNDDGPKHISIVILTTSQAEQDIAQSYRLRANAFVTLSHR